MKAQSRADPGWDGRLGALVRTSARRLRAEVGNRPLGAWVQAPFHRRNYEALRNMAGLCPEFPHVLARYLLGGGDYPFSVRLRTPTGEVTLTLFHPVDVITLNEVFFRVDYRVPNGIATAVDLGSNIGVAAVYFLTRNDAVRCYCVEPDPRNVGKLRHNLRPFEGRFEIAECAVADRPGEVEFAIEPTGRYGGIGVQTGRRITVQARNVNDILEDVLRREERIDVLKVDIEGLEEKTVASIRPDLLNGIDLIYLESREPSRPLHPDRFEQARRGQVTRLASPRAS